MTFLEFLKTAARLAREGIAEDQRRMVKARKEWTRYTTRMGALGLHPLSRAEIEDRQRELASMLVAISTVYVDGPRMRALYDFTRNQEP